MRRTLPRTALPRLALIVALALIAGSVPAASEYRCGDGGKPNKSTKKCDCPAGKVEQTLKDVSRCVDAPKAKTPPPSKPPATKPPAPPPPPPPPEPEPTVAPAPPATTPPPIAWPEPPAPKVPPGTCTANMAWIPGGSYVRGDKSVTVAPFCLDLTEVTVEAMAACVATKKCNEPHPFGKMDGTESRCNWKHVPPRDKHPITCVYQSDAVDYCAFVGKRLPTAAELTWAYRGGDEARTYPWGNEPPSPARLNACGKECVYYKKSEDHIVYDDSDPFPETAPVASFPPSRWGLYDLAGNVEEWTSTQHMPPYPDKVVFGGAWWDRSRDDFVSTASYHGKDQFTAMRGFRCAR